MTDGPEGGSEPGSADAGWDFPRADDVVAAFRALTILAGSGSRPLTGNQALFFPLVGVVLGTAWLAADRVGFWIGSPALRSGLVLAGGVALTGARTLNGLARTLSAAAAGSDREVALRRLDEPPRLALIVGLAALELWLLSEVDRFRTVGLLFSPLLGRWSMVVLAVGSRQARADGRRTKFSPTVRFREFGIASVATFAILFTLTDFLGIMLAAPAALVTVGLRVVHHRWLGGITDATMNATCAVTELLTLAILALF